VLCFRVHSGIPPRNTQVRRYPADRNKGQPYLELRESRTDPRKPGEMLIQVDAPEGGGRYCYQGNQVLDSPNIAATQKREYWTGTNCKDT